MKLHDNVDRLILKAADVMEKQGHVRHSIGKPDGPVCIFGSLMVADGCVMGGTQWDYDKNGSIVEQANQRLEKAFGMWLCSFNNRTEDNAIHIVASMRAVANGDPLPVEPVPA